MTIIGGIIRDVGEVGILDVRIVLLASVWSSGANVLISETKPAKKGPEDISDEPVSEDHYQKEEDKPCHAAIRRASVARDGIIVLDGGLVRPEDLLDKVVVV